MEEYTPSHTNQAPGSMAKHSVPPAILSALRKTKPWVRFIAIIGLALTVLIILISITFMIPNIVSSELLGLDPVEGMIIGLLYTFFALIYVVPSVYLWNFSSSIEKLLKNTDMESLINALVAQQKFWKILGVIFLIWLILSISAFGIVILITSSLLFITR